MNLFEQPRQKRFKKYKTSRVFFEEYLAKLRHHQYKPKIKYRVHILKNYNEVVHLDIKNKNISYQRAIKLELVLMEKLQVFNDLRMDARVFEGFKNTCVNLILTENMNEGITQGLLELEI